MDGHLISLVTIPFFTGTIGYVTNWTGVWMLFYPVRFRGVRIPGVAPLVHLMPRKIQQIPGLMVGGVGWQGIIPSRAAKMGSIAVDKGIAKVGSPAEFYKQLDPERIAEYVLASARRDIRELVDRILEREHPQLWRDLGPQFREAVHARVQEQLPDVVRSVVVEEIGDNIDQLLDVKLMVIRHLEQHPELANRVFTEVGSRELRFIINIGFLFGFLLGIPVAVISEILLPYWFVLPILGIIVGYVTNVVAIKMIFEPEEPRKLGPFKLHGLFLRRQPDAADEYANIIAGEIVTMRNIGRHLLHGPSSDRTRRMIETALRPALDRAVGRLRPAVRVAVGSREYDAIRESLATEGVEYTMTPMTDEELNREQRKRVHDLFSRRTRELPSPDFAEMLRSAMREDEWLLYLHGGVLGLFGGLLHLAVFG